ncbi:MAG TPA: DUF748 domain-containing protein, partial [Steroidobacteraceae bacterium]|nr:DUF748 domain-containing protein [Steroidobacteraceae bacterium]
RSGLQDYVTEHYHRKVELGELRFNPFTLALEAHDFMLPDADAQPLLSFRKLLVNLDIATLWRLGPSFQEIALDEPYARVVIRADGALNLVDLAKPLNTGPPKPVDANAKPMRLFIDKFTVRAGRSEFEDRTRTQPFRAELKPITFDLRDFSTTEQTGNTYALEGASEAGERFKWNGAIRLNPLSSQGQFALTDVQVHTLWSYLSDSVSFETTSGMLGLNGDYDFSAAGSAVALKVNVHDLAVTNLGVKPKGAAANSVELGRIDVHDTRLDVDRHTVTVGKVQLTGGEIRAWLDEHGRLNLLDLAGQPPAAATTASAGPASNAAPAASTASVVPPPSVASSPPAAPAAAPVAPNDVRSPTSPWVASAADISVSGLNLSAEDRQVSPAVAMALKDFTAEIKGFTTAPGSSLDVTASAGINASGKLNVTAKASPDSGAADANIELAQLDLTVFQPYLARQTQLTLKRGLLGTKLHVQRAADGALIVEGDTEVTRLDTEDNENRRDFIKWEGLKVQKLRYQSAPASLQIGSVLAQAPYARVIIAKDRTVNVSDVMQPPGATPPVPAVVEPAAATKVADKKAAKKSTRSSSREKAARKSAGATASAPVPETKPAGDAAMPVSIGTVRIVNGSANFSDLWIQPNFAIGIQSLNGSIVGLSSN